MPGRGENIYKRKDGRWEGRYIVDKINSGKIIYKSVYGHSYLETKHKLAELKYTYHGTRQNTVLADKLIVAAVSREWLDFKKSRVKESSFIKYTNIIENYIVFNMGSLKLKKITLHRVEIFISSLLKNGGRRKKSLSVKTVSDIISVLKRIFKYAGQKHQIALCDISKLKIGLNVSRKPVKETYVPTREYTEQANIVYIDTDGSKTYEPVTFDLYTEEHYVYEQYFTAEFTVTDKDGNIVYRKTENREADKDTFAMFGRAIKDFYNDFNEIKERIRKNTEKEK